MEGKERRGEGEGREGGVGLNQIHCGKSLRTPRGNVAGRKHENKEGKKVRRKERKRERRKDACGGESLECQQIQVETRQSKREETKQEIKERETSVRKPGLPSAGENLRKQICGRVSVVRSRNNIKSEKIIYCKVASSDQEREKETSRRQDYSAQ